MRWLTLPEYVSRAREANAEKKQRKNNERTVKETWRMLVTGVEQVGLNNQSFSNGRG
jgi:hypothetical protein